VDLASLRRGILHGIATSLHRPFTGINTVQLLMLSCECDKRVGCVVSDAESSQWYNAGCQHFRPCAVRQRLAPQVCQRCPAACMSCVLYLLSCLTMCQHTKAILSIGGWGGSRYFSSYVGSSASRTVFAQKVMEIVGDYKLHGIEFECGHFSVS